MKYYTFQVLFYCPKKDQRKNLRSKPYKIVSLRTMNQQQIWKATAIVSFFPKGHWIILSSRM